MAADPPPELIDVDLLALIGGPEPAVVLGILEDFAVSFPAGMDSLDEFLDSADYPSAVDLLHRQKGAAGSLGLTALHRSLAAMETGCERGTPPSPGARSELTAIVTQSIDAARACLQSL